MADEINVIVIKGKNVPQRAGSLWEAGATMCRVLVVCRTMQFRSLQASDEME